MNAIAVYAATATIIVNVISRSPWLPRHVAGNHLVQFVLLTALMAPLATSSSAFGILGILVAVVLLKALVTAVAPNSEVVKAVTAFVPPILIFLIFADSRIAPRFNPTISAFAAWLFRGSRVIDASDTVLLNNICVYLGGVVLAAAEANTLVALVLRRLQLLPTEPTDQHALFNGRDAGRGKAIGYIERAIIFVLVLTGNVAGIGIVVAAKAVTRFRELDSRDFAEYFLVGTLLSTALGAGIGAVFTLLLSA